MKTTNKILSVFIFLVLIGGFFYARYEQNKKAELVSEIKAYKLREDKLIKISNGQYSKLVADSLTKRELSKKIKELGIDLKKALLAQKIVIVPRDTIKIIDSIKTTDTTITFLDFYPNKHTPFVTHTTEFKTKDTTAIGIFKFIPISLNLAIGQKEDGTYEVKTKFPEYFDVRSIDVQTLPVQQIKPDNFGILFGADYVKSLDAIKTEIDLNTYLRFKKFYIGGGIRTDNTIKAGIKIEF